MRRLVVTSVLVVLWSTAVGNAWGEVQYSLTDLGQGGATAINDSGQVVGWYQSTNHAFLYSNGTMSDIGTLGGDCSDFSCANGINASGQVVGYSGSYGNDTDRDRPAEMIA